MTIERVMGRAIEDVREFVTDKLDDYIGSGDEENVETIGIAILTARSISAGDMLTKEQAVWLREFLENRMNYALDMKYDSKLSLSDIDELSIYADAWGLYCRPGTYSI